jgi:hypothetical protein
LRSEDKKRLEDVNFQPGAKVKKFWNVGESLTSSRRNLYMGDVMRTISPTQRKSLEFVKKELSDGQPKEVVALQMKARAEGIPTRSLTTSRKMLRVAVFRDGQCGKFYWRMSE